MNILRKSRIFHSETFSRVDQYHPNAIIKILIKRVFGILISEYIFKWKKCVFKNRLYSKSLRGLFGNYTKAAINVVPRPLPLRYEYANTVYNRNTRVRTRVRDGENLKLGRARRMIWTSLTVHNMRTQFIPRLHVRVVNISRTVRRDNIVIVLTAFAVCLHARRRNE